MPINPLGNWHQLVQDRNPKGFESLLSDQVVFHSPVVHTPQIGKAITTQYLTAAFHVFFNQSFSISAAASSGIISSWCPVMA